jgi:2-dehydro-3-deoxygalactonokinase
MSKSGDKLLLCVDMGTTRTRAWLTRRDEVLANLVGDFGVRNVSAGESRDWLRLKLIRLLNGVLESASKLGVSEKPVAVIAAGMITSDQGLREVPHLQAPVGLSDLATQLHMEQISLSDTMSLPLFLVPGVRSGHLADSIEGAMNSDLMRGEETLCVGLIANGLMRPGTVLFNLGSHWKCIWTDNEGRIIRSRTSLTGEMIHVVQTNTLIAASLPQQPPRTLDSSWVDYGFTETARSGLSRALFCVRLLHLRKQGTEEQRLSFVYGAFLQTEIAHLKTTIDEGTPSIMLAGSPCVANMWRVYASNAGFSSRVLLEREIESAYLRGLAQIYAESGHDRFR